MTEQELRIEFQRISEENNYLQMLNEDDAVDLCKSYANARESKEIAELKAKNAALVAALEEITQAEYNLQESIDLCRESPYQLKTDAELVAKIAEFGFGELEFHTADIQRLVTQSLIAKEAIAANEKGGMQE